MRKVLVVDDEAFMRRLLSDMFARSNPSVKLIFASSVAEALNVIEEHDDFGTLLTDFNLGDGTGNEVARHFTQKFPKAAVFGMTGNPEHSFDLSFFQHVLEKPFVRSNDKAVLESICS